MRIYFNPGYVMTEFNLSFGYDLNESAMGMKYYNSNNLDGFLIDGKNDEKERNFNPDTDIWRLITGPQGSMIYATIWDKHFEEQATIEAYYNDDIIENVGPEDIPGSIGSFGSRITVESLSAGDYLMIIGWFMPANFYNPDKLNLKIIDEFLDILRIPLMISIDGNPPFVNTGGAYYPLH